MTIKLGGYVAIGEGEIQAWGRTREEAVSHADETACDAGGWDVDALSFEPASVGVLRRLEGGDACHDYTEDKGIICLPAETL